MNAVPLYNPSPVDAKRNLAREQCDDGNIVAGDACSEICIKEL